MSNEPVNGDNAWSPPTEDDWIEDSIAKISLIRKKVWGKVLSDGASRDGAQLDDPTKIMAIKLLADKLISPYHYYCENQRKEWMTEWARSARNKKPKPDKKIKGEGNQEAPDPEMVEHHLKNSDSPLPNETPSLPQEPPEGVSTTGQSGASPYINMPKFKVNKKNELVPICPRCDGDMDDCRPNPMDVSSRTLPGLRGTRKPDFKCLNIDCNHPIWLNSEEEAKEKRGSPARAWKEAEKLLEKSR